MNVRPIHLWRTPNRLSLGQAKFFAGLAIFILLLASTGLVLYEGWPRFVHVSALGLVGLTNLALALGSLISEERGGKALRDAVVPLSLLMLVALAASVVMHWDGAERHHVLIGLFGGLIGLVVLRRIGR